MTLEPRTIPTIYKIPIEANTSMCTQKVTAYSAIMSLAPSHCVARNLEWLAGNLSFALKPYGLPSMCPMTSWLDTP